MDLVIIIDSFYVLTLVTSNKVGHVKAPFHWPFFTHKSKFSIHIFTWKLYIRDQNSNFCTKWFFLFVWTLTDNYPIAVLVRKLTRTLCNNKYILLHICRILLAQQPTWLITLDINKVKVNSYWWISESPPSNLTSCNPTVKKLGEAVTGYSRLTKASQVVN